MYGGDKMTIGIDIDDTITYTTKRANEIPSLTVVHPKMFCK